jgi:hypothetical protein
MVTLQPQRAYLRAREYVYTGRWIRQEFPAFRKFANKLVSLAISINWSEVDKNFENTKAIQEYLSLSTLLEKLEIHLRATYYAQKSLIPKFSIPTLSHSFQR